PPPQQSEKARSIVRLRCAPGRRSSSLATVPEILPHFDEIRPDFVWLTWDVGWNPACALDSPCYDAHCKDSSQKGASIFDECHWPILAAEPVDHLTADEEARKSSNQRAADPENDAFDIR